ncbi:MAG: DUF2807 domain-containing protein [Muribaculaceae bacterium]|nr:DUF2807 domain-containing protein [Muribaculaceae bacterium]
MRILHKILLSAFMILLLPAIAAGRDYTYNVGPFDKLSERGNINIIYRCVPDSSGIVKYTSDRDFGKALEITNEKGKLFIKETRHNLGEVPTVYVYSHYLTNISLDGDATIQADMTAKTPKFGVSLTGNGRIEVSGLDVSQIKASYTAGNGQIILTGTTQTAKFNLTGAGRIEADNLQARNVSCTVIGGGDIYCWSTTKLDITGIGTTRIHYKGCPEIKKVGGATVAPIPE